MSHADAPAPPVLAVTLGDPAGIGPEVAAAALRQAGALDPAPELVVVGPTGTVADGTATRFDAVGHWDGDAGQAGTLAYRAIERAARMALDGLVDGIVTGPIDKAALNAAGHAWPGHTELLAALSGVTDVSMMMCAETTLLGGPLRVVLATTHVPLAAVPGLLSADLLIRQSRIAAAALRDAWGITAPRIALCAFNPHASDGGLFGDEEARVYAPALAALRQEGLDVDGPLPADTVFLRAAQGAFDAVIAPYHDVGMAAFKTVSFGRGANVTLGLPFVRTSPDHGTARDIAGRGQADASSMITAIGLAARLAVRQRARSVTP